MGTAPRDLGIAGSSGFIGTVGLLVVAVGLALAVIVVVGDTPAVGVLEGAPGGAALGALISAPGVLALLALAARPALLLAAATVLVPLSFVSLAGATLPLLVPAAMLFVAYGRRSAQRRAGGAMAMLVTLWVVGMLIAAGLALFLHQDPRTSTTAIEGGSTRDSSTLTTEMGSTSDVITVAEALLSLGLTVVAIGGGWWLSGRAHTDRVAEEVRC